MRKKPRAGAGMEKKKKIKDQNRRRKDNQ